MTNEQQAMANAQDLQFLDQATFLNATEIADGLLASQLSPSFAVAQFGFEELVDHTSLNVLLQSITQTEGLPTPVALTAVFQSQINNYESVFGPNSDQDYLNKEVLGHQQSLTIYQQEAQSGQDPLLRSYAQGSISVLQGHLNQATNLLGSENCCGF